VAGRAVGPIAGPPVPRLYYSPTAMARRSLRPELNRIRAWVRQGRTDAWIAHQLDVTVQQIQSFKRDQSLEATDEAETNGAVADLDEEIDLRAEDDALIAAELDAAVADSVTEEEEGDEDEADKPARRRRGRRGAGPAVLWKRPSTTVRRATASGWTPPCRTTPSTRSHGRGTGRSR
jgi:hypothetical protein